MVVWALDESQQVVFACSVCEAFTNKKIDVVEAHERACTGLRCAVCVEKSIADHERHSEIALWSSVVNAMDRSCACVGVHRVQECDGRP